MSFLTPAFLFGALALAVPVLVHLTHREKSEIFEFPSLMFVRKIPYRSVRRQRLRHLLLFALRCLALLAIVVAFARPFFEDSRAATASPLGPREIVLVVDHSYSMGYDGRLDRAKDEALARLSSLGPDERGSLVVFSDRAEILSESSTDAVALSTLVSGIELSSRTTSYGPALKLAKKILDESKLSRKEVVLISDFQRLGWQGDEDVWLPSGTELVPVDISAGEAENLSVTGVVLERDSSSGRERLRASARVTYKAPDESAPVKTQLHVELDGRSIQTKSLELSPNSSETISFDPFTLPEGMSRGTIRAEPDKLPQDNAFHFVLWPGQAVSVLALESRSAARRGFYINRALEIGDRPSFRVESKQMSELRASDLNGPDVVLVNDVSSMGDAQGKWIERFVEEGGGLVLVLGEASGPNSYTGAAAHLLPSPLGPPIDRAREWGGTLSYLDYSSPVFELFSAPHSGDFSSSKFFRYRRFTEPVPDGVIARYDDGAPALVERRMGEGRVLSWTSTLDTFWNDLARQPVFLPFVHQLVRHAAGYSEADPWQNVGTVVDLVDYLDKATDTSERGETRDYDLVVTSPTGENTIEPPGDERALLTLEEQGFYELRRAGRRASEPITLAANLDVAESDLAALDPEELVASVTFREMETADAGATETPADHERRQGFWWYLLAGALGLLAAESMLSNRLSRAAR
jgi:hypothetical protein